MKVYRFECHECPEGDNCRLEMTCHHDCVPNTPLRCIYGYGMDAVWRPRAPRPARTRVRAPGRLEEDDEGATREDGA